MFGLGAGTEYREEIEVDSRYYISVDNGKGVEEGEENSFFGSTNRLRDGRGKGEAYSEERKLEINEMNQS